ncbi:uncharacterized protein LOC105695534 isoform X1 [Orussus abietinus]|uniref:uncharacterized protein LOC105695534 isoform X1 n=2 Tax=Orussus abietinus TaxID=222816 RepID=UPI000626B50E|nr:uncharacterized protein LOC105695534 isoform X1 [Orussus abietinus]
MGLLLSVLVGCVGALELLACLRHASESALVASSSPAPCLAYHEDSTSIHDAICTFSHSRVAELPESARNKLENLHEYSLRVRSQLRSLDPHFDGTTLSECSTADILGTSRSDSRLSLDFDLVQDERTLGKNLGIDVPKIDPKNRTFGAVVVQEVLVDVRDGDLNEGALSAPPLVADRYVRVPTPIPCALEEDISGSSSCSSVSERRTSFDFDSGNEAPTRRSFENLCLGSRYEFSSSGLSSTEDLPQGRSLGGDELLRVEDSRDSRSRSPRSADREKGSQGIRKPRSSKHSSAVLRKPTRLKSKNAEVSKSAENLSTKKTKRSRAPERRMSDISVQTGRQVRDEWTNTSPSESELSRSASKGSVSVEVQTSFEEVLHWETSEIPDDPPVLGLSESKKDLLSRRKAFRSRRGGSSKGSAENEDAFRNRIIVTRATNALKDLEDEEEQSLKISSFEIADDDDYEAIESRSWRRKDGSKGEDGRSRMGPYQGQGSNGYSRSSSGTKSFENDTSDEFLDALDGDTSRRRPIDFSASDTDGNKAFWLIFSGEYARTMNKDWHSGHFCCWQCDESLTGQRYVLRDEHPYCIKCYESVFANGCEECNKIIGIDSKDLSYKDKHWHEACFLCNKCRVSLVDKQFGSKVDKIYCGNCYDAQFASRCDGCGEIFRAGTKKMEYKTRQWHEKCFCCVVCKNPIGTKSFIPREQEIYCAGCYEDKFATRCVKCNKIITSGGVTYKNEPWHRDCFTCSNCNNSLAGQRFTSRDDKPYCAECFGELFAKRCTACSKPITGIGGTRFISFEDRHWHNDCFICAGCKTSLVGHGFITDGDDIICPECAKQKLL